MDYPLSFFYKDLAVRQSFVVVSILACTALERFEACNLYFVSAECKQTAVVKLFAEHWLLGRDIYIIHASFCGSFYELASSFIVFAVKELLDVDNLVTL
jgi:hypothetical protein